MPVSIGGIYHIAVNDGHLPHSCPADGFSSIAPNSAVILTFDDWRAVAESEAIENPAATWSDHHGKGRDYATFNRMARGTLVSVGIMPEGVAVVSKDQWETGNQMGVLKEDYLDTLEWMEEELQEELNDPTVKIPVDVPDCEVVYSINPREVKYDPRSIAWSETNETCRSWRGSPATIARRALARAGAARI